ncbi:hypothetical protein F4818DRAFT_403885 [Hypoxylon cercidicola]|nr:hypothetical protein F4818DRAFT_403885 [Hypoxylon cercidicola]
MKFNQTILTLLALSSAVVAAPAAADSNAATAESQGQMEWTGDNTARTPPLSAPYPNTVPATNTPSPQHILEARAKGRGERCTVGKGQCGSGLGCFGCLGHKPVCQEGPGSNQCCFDDDRGRRCEILPIGK